MTCAQTIVVAAKLPTWQYRSTTITKVVKKKTFEEISCAKFDLQLLYLHGLTIVINEIEPIKHQQNNEPTNTIYAE
jgi:hypothetical protein